MNLTFLGAAGTVTGSKYLLETVDKKLLIDCGVFQGTKNHRERNWEDPTFKPESIDAVVLTHAHIDHTGYLPVLHKHGYRGPVFCTPGTAELAGILLPDSGYLQEEEAAYLNRHKLSRHSPALPLYTRKDSEATLSLLQTVDMGKAVEIGNIRVRFTRAGHILGSACVHVESPEGVVVFSGDVGRADDPVMRPPVPIEHADFLVCESTYGNRRHRETDPFQQVGETIRRTVARGGTLVIPAFAVGRTQSILHVIAVLRERGEIPDVPVYLNSPMAINATKIFCDHAGEHRLNDDQCTAMFDAAEMVKSSEASKALNTNQGPAVIISASGMATGGRVVHHLKTLLPDPRNTVMFAGFQASGTRGDALVGGADEVKIHGEFVRVRADIVSLDGMSAHGDYVELLDWLGQGGARPKRTFITHGEPAAADAMRQHIESNLRWKCHVPEHMERVELK